MLTKDDKSLIVVLLGYALFLGCLILLLTSMVGCDSGWSVAGYEI